ncbi:MAG: hypothetical protein JWO90_1342 [Solirubrobacterales bacterium]|nr:hypothetical protein [Solirubrobacterales bacterium]
MSPPPEFLPVLVLGALAPVLALFALGVALAVVGIAATREACAARVCRVIPGVGRRHGCSA